MQEDLLHFVWKHRLFELSTLETVGGESITLHKTGRHNHSSGPDFLEADLTIGGVRWVGSVEIHVRSSDWHHHGHSGDPAYANVVLHVVFEDDKPVLNPDGMRIPTLVLNGRLSQALLSRYSMLKTSQRRIPCAYALPEVAYTPWNLWLDRLMVERLQRKTSDIELIFKLAIPNDKLY